MSNSQTEPTSMTGSSASSVSDGGSGGSGGQGGWGAGGPHAGGQPPRASRADIEVIACGALAGHIREIAARRGWPVIVRPLPAGLHNRPEEIHRHSERIVATAQANGSRAVLAYADCGTYGALDKVCDARGVKRLPGLHCYDLFAGPARIAEIFAEEPGTYLLTDYLVRAFDRTVLSGLGLDRHPELWPDYFGHYTRVVWLAQEPTPALETQAMRIADLFGLPLSRLDTGTTGLEAALAALIESP
jgi:hypothetical protein